MREELNRAMKAVGRLLGEAGSKSSREAQTQLSRALNARQGFPDLQGHGHLYFQSLLVLSSLRSSHSPEEEPRAGEDRERGFSIPVQASGRRPFTRNPSGGLQRLCGL